MIDLQPPASPTNLARHSSPPALAPFGSHSAPNAHPLPPPPPPPPPPQNGSLRQRHTLQVPKPSNSRASTTAGGSDAFASGRFSPTSAAPRRGSLSIVRRNTRSLTDAARDDILPDEDAAKWTEAIRAKRAEKRRREEEEADDKVVVGTKVDHNHTNWVTAYNMLTGIRFVVSRINAKMHRDLTEEDFSACHKFSFDMTGNELTPSAKYDFKFKDYSPWVFRDLRAKFGLDPADYLMSLTSKYILSELGSPGKSGSFFYFSRDYKYIIKTIHHGEHKFLRKILRDYYQHIQQNPNTLISQFYGLHRVKTSWGRKIHFVVMNNLFPPHRDIHTTYDLKGSTIGRDYNEENISNNPNAVLKDLNWLRRDMHLNLGPTKRRLFVEQVQRDVELLKRLGVMDYSLLLGIHDLNRGNKDDIRNSALKVFQPGGPVSDEIQGHMLQRTPSKMEKARQARELRDIIYKEVPVSLDQDSANRLPDEFSEHKKTLFYADDGGFRTTHENNEPDDMIYYLGIIDCLTHYGFIKKVEHFWRGLSHPKDQVSAIPPDRYGERFFNFITGLVKSKEEVQREKENAGNGDVSEETAAAIKQPDNTMPSSSGTQQQMSEEPRVRSIIRSPSAERTGGLAGTTLPVVEEDGEGSSPGRTITSDSGTSTGRHDQGPMDVPSDYRGCRSASDDVNSKPDSAVSFDSHHHSGHMEHNRLQQTIAV
ncbi:SAICAR synthase-like protein [Ascodesmis nigricans]|uniref:1-phosphatidylinositol-4-phosphate 5-kinase n=1 Tax=Ascodesmis nigricans TaxID=341454 RepID=A0A4S2N1B0_9PEZI|nr:SAICAR synthase-like protein [Ascodesmis nigricans]